MLFNSIGFLFAFLPAVLLAYYLLGSSRLHALRRPLLIVATLLFYGLGGWNYVPLLLTSVVLNYSAALVIGRVRDHHTWRTLALVGAVLANLLVLGYFKYFNFLLRTFNSAFDAGFELERILLPLGISFFTFQQIGYLIDVSRGRIAAGKPLDFASFVLFFPQLLAGPIVQYAEVIPQHRAPVDRKAIGQNILIGLVIFTIGLFKKTVIADTAALYASPVFSAARAGDPVGMLDVWIGAFAYTAQVYFDFSGYSDMAIGTARMFSIILPLNFHSPLRSSSVVEIWRRWHITLGRWVGNYIFRPISMPMARFAANRGLGKYGTLTFAVLLPTMISMLIIGIWHGAGWTFVIFGLMQGIYMVVNEAWAAFRRKARKLRKKEKGGPPVWHAPVARGATLIAFVVAIIPFGSVALDDMGAMFFAMFGGGSAFVAPGDWPSGLAGALVTIGLCYAIILAGPNTQQIMARFNPVLEWNEKWSKIGIGPLLFEWRMTIGWAVAAGVVFFLAVAFIMRGTTEFIYFNF